jgi:DNA-binding CsgD family transcriptional regulator
VAFHKYKIMERLRIKTNSELVQYAMQEHMISPRS